LFSQRNFCEGNISIGGMGGVNKGSITREKSLVSEQPYPLTSIGIAEGKSLEKGPDGTEGERA